MQSSDADDETPTPVLAATVANGNGANDDDAVTLPPLQSADTSHQSQDSYELYASRTTASIETETEPETTAIPAGADDLSEPDEESSLVERNESELKNSVYFEPPFSAPLAPFIVAEPKKSQRSSAEKRRKAQMKRFKSESCVQQAKKTKSYESICDLFIQRERGMQTPTLTDRDDEAKHADGDSGWGGDAVAGNKKKKKSRHAFGKNSRDKSYLNDSINANLLLPEDLQLSHFNKSHNKIAPTRNHKLKSNNNTSSPLEPMTDSNLDNLENNLENGNIEFDRQMSFECENYTKYNKSLYFDDGIRTVDFVLAYRMQPQEQVENSYALKRKKYEENLELQGLEIERVHKEEQQIYFVKIHAPLEVLRCYAEILKFRMPMKEELCEMTFSERSHRLRHAAQYLSRKIPGMSVVNRSTRSVFASLKSVFSFFLRYIYVDENCFPKRTHRFTAIYSRDKEYLFDVNHDCFFTHAVRSRIVQFILDREHFDDKDKDPMAFGIERLVEADIYCAAYPLHDGEVTERGTMREKLSTHWASIRQWYRYQPLDYVKDYFGVKIGLYFAWLGYYTYMLLLASIVGLICFIYSWATLKDHVPVKDVCYHENVNHNITMCPLCDWCNFWDLKETCFYAKITYLIDNPSTVFFAVFMSFWATLFLELWKRYSAEITHRWDLTGFDVHEEHPRPQYLARLANLPNTRTRVDYVTNIREPMVPFWRMKLPATVFSFSVVLLLVMLAFVALLAVVVYRISMLGILKVGSNAMTTSSAIMLATASAAFVNLCLLYVLNYMYNHLAEYLTELEMWRTQTQFDDSLTLKIYLLQFVNYYASIFYIAFFKGKFVGRPGLYNKIFDYRQEECSSGGCLTELCIQLAIIMIGKQAFNTLLEVIMPKIWRRFMAIKNGLSRLFTRKKPVNKEKIERWVRDLKLLEWGARSLFPEYLEMVLQYGFVTIFVAAFPLAPVFALLNNIFEMRLDAQKLLTHHRRPVSQRVRDIGVWYRILDSIGKLSVITNGFIIAFTSDFIPRLVYRAHVSKEHTLNGYLEFTLSEFRIGDSPTLRSLAGDNSTITTCKYTDYREPPGSPKEYDLTSMFYIILACRLGFVVLFENFVALVMILVRWCIPDMSVELRDQIRREIYLTNEIIIGREAERARFRMSKQRISESEVSSTNTM